MILPKGEELRRAVRWLSEQPSWDLATIEQASRRFDLSPRDQEFLIRELIHRRPASKQDD
jgi:hypothetical protein